MEDKSIEKTAALDSNPAADIELGNDGNPVQWKSISRLTKRFENEGLQTPQKRLETGFAGLNKALGGGIYPGLIVLGGSPGVGKSTFALQVAAEVSKQTPVLYFSMEMTQDRIVAKFISRYMKENLSLDQYLTADELVRGEPEPGQWGTDIWQAIEQARLYIEKELENLYIIVKPMDAEKIVKEVKRFIGDKELVYPPLVIVDYLQILPPVNEKEIIERKIVEKSLDYMKELAHKGIEGSKKITEIPIILISSLSRSSYESSMQIDSFKETGGIEYSADLLMGLQFQACHGKDKMDINEERRKEPRKVELVILKQRYGKIDDPMNMKFYAAHDYFKETTAEKQDENTQEGQETVDQEKNQENQQEETEDRGDRILGAVMCNTKVANEIRLGLYTPKQQTDCEVMKDVITKYSVSEKLTCFDCDVADAIYTLLSKYDRDNFTVRQVLRFLSGDEQQILTQQKSDNIIESIKRLRDTHIAIHCEAEMKKREKTEAKSFDGKFLNVICEETTRCKKNENSCENCREKNRKYRFDESNGPVMPLYAYGEKTRQMISFPRKLLHVRKKDGQKLSDTTETICIKRYLIRRLEILRNRKNKNAGFRNITFRAKGELADLLRELDKSSHKTKLQKQRKLHDTVTEILKYYQEIGYIQGYSDQKTYVKITGTVNDPWKLEALQQNETEESKEQEI